MNVPSKDLLRGMTIPGFYPKALKEEIQERLNDSFPLSARGRLTLDRMLRSTIEMQKVFGLLKVAFPDSETIETDSAYFVASAWACASEDYQHLRESREETKNLLLDIVEHAETLAGLMRKLNTMPFRGFPELSDLAELIQSSLPAESREPARGTWKSMSPSAFGLKNDPNLNLDLVTLKHIFHVWQSAPTFPEVLDKISELVQKDGVATYPDFEAAISGRKRDERTAFLRAFKVVLEEAGFPITYSPLRKAVLEIGTILLEPENPFESHLVTRIFKTEK